MKRSIENGFQNKITQDKRNIRKIRWLIEADRDFYAIFTSLEQVSVHYAKRFFETVLEIEKHISTYPYIGRKVPEINENRIREVIFLKYRMLHYIKSEEILEILAIIHQSSDIRFKKTR